MTKKTFEARPGVEWVNGQRVPANRKMDLTAAEAKFDLDHGRIRVIDTAVKSVPAASGSAEPSKPSRKTAD